MTILLSQWLFQFKQLQIKLKYIFGTSTGFEPMAFEYRKFFQDYLQLLEL